MDYHLSIGGGQKGPLTQFQVISGIRDGSLKGDELAWTKGFSEWVPLKQIEDFAGYWPVTPEVIEQAQAARQIARIELDKPRPWLRFAARMVDYLWFTTTLWMLMGAMLPQAALAWVVKMYFKGAPFDPLFLLLYVPLEAWLLSRRGTTPGKALLCMQVRTSDGGLPTYRQALARALHVYVRGVAMGLFLISILTMNYARVRLMRRKITSWDESLGLRVEHGEPEGWRILLLLIMAFFMVLGAALAFSTTPEMIEAMRSLPK